MLVPNMADQPTCAQMQTNGLAPTDSTEIVISPKPSHAHLSPVTPANSLSSPANNIPPHLLATARLNCHTNPAANSTTQNKRSTTAINRLTHHPSHNPSSNLHIPSIKDLITPP